MHADDRHAHRDLEGMCFLVMKRYNETIGLRNCGFMHVSQALDAGRRVGVLHQTCLNYEWKPVVAPLHAYDFGSCWATW
jgi:hypothetical protein